MSIKYVMLFVPKHESPAITYGSAMLVASYTDFTYSNLSSGLDVKVEKWTGQKLGLKTNGILAAIQTR